MVAVPEVFGCEACVFEIVFVCEVVALSHRVDDLIHLSQLFCVQEVVICRPCGCGASGRLCMIVCGCWCVAVAELLLSGRNGKKLRGYFLLCERVCGRGWIKSRIFVAVLRLCDGPRWSGVLVRVGLVRGSVAVAE